jgi:ribosomal subunit interface protein
VSDHLQITFRDMTSSETIDARIRERAAKLDEHFDRIVACRVAIEAPHRRHQSGPEYRCRIDLVVPNAELVAETPEGKDLPGGAYGAVDEAFDEIARQLDSYLQRSRWDVKQHGRTPHARVSKLMREEPKGTRYGFLETHDGREIYFHENAVLHGNYHKLEIGSEVRFAEEDGEKGPQASTVAVTKRRSRETTTTADADAVPESR